MLHVLHVFAQCERVGECMCKPQHVRQQPASKRLCAGCGKKLVVINRELNTCLKNACIANA